MKKKINVESFKKELTDSTLKQCDNGIDKAIEHGRIIHASGKPLPEGDDLSLYIRPVTSWFETISSELNNKVNSVKEVMIGSFANGSFSEQDKQYTDTIRSKQEVLDNIERDEKRLPSDQSLKSSIFFAVACAITVGESLYSVTALQGSGASFIALFFYFISLFATYMVLSKTLANWVIYSGSLSRVKRWAGHIGLTLFFSTAFYLLGLLRIASLKATAIGDEVVTHSAFNFMTVNMFFLCASVALHVFRKPLVTTPEVAKKRRELAKKKSGVVKGLKNEKKAHETFKKEYPEDQRGRVALLGIINPLHKLVISKHNQAVEAFKSEILARTQGKAPDCLTQVIDPLTPADYFDQETLNTQDS